LYAIERVQKGGIYLYELIFAAVNSCHGDSGGSFALEHKGRWYIRGVVSLGIKQILTIKDKPTDTCNENFPSLFVDLASSMDWILQTVQPP
jgi:secreted trypsin-like serine protease